MKLYRIRRISDGKYFSGWLAPWNPKYYGRAKFYDIGTFFHKIDTVAWHLQGLCSEWVHNERAIRFKAKSRTITKMLPERAKLYEIVVNDVTIMGEEVLNATKILKAAGAPK